MDRIVNVRMFSVEAKEDGGMAFSQALRHIADLQPLARREHETEPDVIIRLEDLNPTGRIWFGEMVRVQEVNLPPKALRGQRRERLGIRSIGHTSVFAFDTRLSVLALQLSRNGITAARKVPCLNPDTAAIGLCQGCLPIPLREDILPSLPWRAPRSRPETCYPIRTGLLFVPRTLPHRPLPSFGTGRRPMPS